MADESGYHPSYLKPDVASTIGRDMAQTALTLADIVGTGVAGGAPVRISGLRLPQGAGASNETIIFDADWTAKGQAQHRGLVLRIAPADFQLFMDPRMQDQFHLMQVLRRQGRVRVAEPLLYSADPEPFGQPYFLMGRLEGQVPVSFPPYNASGFLFDATVAQRRTSWESAIDQMAQVTCTPLADVAFLAEADGDGDFDRHFSWWIAYARWAKVDHLPAIAAVEAWLIANRPADPPPGLSWGDARIGNMMFGADFTVAGVMDWEQLSLGGALLDLGWWLYFDRFHSDALGLRRLDGLGDRQETIMRWQGITGIEALDLEWYEILAGYKLAIIIARKQALERTSAPSNNGNNNIITQLNALWLGQPVPEDILEI